MALPLNDGSMWEPTEEQIQNWTAIYPAIDVIQELNAMWGWLDANPTRRKTKRGITRFVNSWLARAQDKGGSPLARKDVPHGTIKTRDMTSLDDLTHNFLGDQAMTDYFLEKFGQCFVNGERITR